MASKDYALDVPPDTTIGLRQGLPSYGNPHFSLFLCKVFIKALGYSEDALSRPIIGIINTYSSFNPCHSNIPQLIEAVKRVIQLSGVLAVDFPTISIHEAFSSPTSMYLRNLMSMDTEEMIAAQPCDAVVMIGGKASSDDGWYIGNKPILQLVTGPMMPGSQEGTRIGACTDCRNNWAKYRAQAIDIEDISAVNEELAPTAGTCGVMGTASTMACVLVALGMMPFSGATAPAVSSARLRVAEATGKYAVSALKAREKMRPRALLMRESFLNAITVLQAIGGSTNVVVHLLAIINRHPKVTGTITIDTIDDIGRKTPLLLDLKPSGQNYMTDFHNSGGILALLRELKPLLYLDALTITGQTMGEALADARLSPVPRHSSCVQPFDDPLYPASSLVVLRGNLAPGGAVMKASASKDKRLLKHSGRAVAFVNSTDLAARIGNMGEYIEIGPGNSLVLQNIGLAGNPGMPESGMIPIHRKLGSQGVLDMLRISDGRMSGTAGGTIVLHISPEAADPSSVLGIVQTGDVINCDVDKRLLQVEISSEEIFRRQEERLTQLKGSNFPWQKRDTMRGYRGMYMRSVNQAQDGADFSFLTAAGPSSVPEKR